MEQLSFQALFMILTPIILIVAQVVLAWKVARAGTSWGILLKLLVITTFTTMVWVFIGALIGQTFSPGADPKPLHEQPDFILFIRTLALPFNLCAVFPDFNGILGIRFCYDYSSFLVLPGGLLLIGLLVLAAMRIPSRIGGTTKK